MINNPTDHERQVFEAIKAQARIGQDKITEQQVDYVYFAGQSAKRYIMVAAYEAMAKLRNDRNVHDNEDCTPENPNGTGGIYTCDVCTVIAEFSEAVEAGRQREQASIS
jgi:di/tripeptidase